MANMAKDLAFFSIIWCIIIFAFGTAMLGAGDVQDKAKEQPMQNWGLWWFFRTYMQSLGHDYISEMQTNLSNIIFLFMWPIVNVLLVS